MAIFLIRHGETDANAARIVQRPTVPLSARGRAQAQALAARLADAEIETIIASDLERAAETARALAAVTALPITFDPGLHERNYGEIRGTAYADLAEDIFGPDYAPPGGETWAVFHARVDAAWQRATAVASRARTHVAVVTHGLVCQRILAAHLDAPADVVVEAMRWDNTCVTQIDGPGFRHVHTLACVRHLDTVVDGARA